MSRSLDRLTLLQTFVRISDAGSISAAARDLGLSQPSASRQLAELEARLKTQLIRRNTHSLSLTQAGLELLADARQILDGWESLEEKHLAADTDVKGALKVVAPVALGQLHLARIACGFQIKYPGVSMTWLLEDHAIRFSEIGCDCWIKVGTVPDDSLVVRRLGTVERILVASRAFIDQHGSPKTPRAAERLPFVALDPFEGSRVSLFHGRKRDVSVSPMPRMRTNNIFALREAVLMGIGMAVLPRWFVADELDSGVIRNVLPGWSAQSLPIHVAYLPGRHKTLRLRAFLDEITEAVPKIEGFGIDQRA